MPMTLTEPTKNSLHATGKSANLLVPCSFCTPLTEPSKTCPFVTKQSEYKFHMSLTKHTPKLSASTGKSTHLLTSCIFYLPLTEPPRGCLHATDQTEYHLAIFRCPDQHTVKLSAGYWTIRVSCALIQFLYASEQPNTILIEDLPLCFNSKSKTNY